MHLVVFDIDGTLIDSAHSQLDDRCFWQSIREVSHIGNADEPIWVDDLRHVTASGIVSQFCEQHLGRLPTPAESRQIRQLYEAALTAALGNLDAHAYSTVGATTMLRKLRRRTDLVWSIATGCFEATARLKLGFAGLAEAETKLATSDDAMSREDIMQIAARRACRPGRKIDRFTYVGDGVWDLKAAKNLGWDFIGIARGKRAAELRREGAVHVLPHFKPATAFLALLA